MAHVNPRLIYWIGAVHKHPALSPAHRDILTYLAVMKLDYGTGRGYCSVPTLASGRGWNERTVRRALELGRVKEPQLLNRTRRGHRMGDGRVIASEWALIYPPMPVDNGTSTGHARPVDPISTGLSPDLNRTLPTSQPDTRVHPTGIESSTGNESSTGHRAVAQLRSIDPGVTVEEALAVLDELASRPAVRDPLAVLGAEIASGNGYALILRARHRADRAIWNGYDTTPAHLHRPWCGQCDEFTRHIDLADGRVTRCPRCHFSMMMASSGERWSAIIAPGRGVCVGTADDMQQLATLLTLDDELAKR
jgi:hypothetical protein